MSIRIPMTHGQRQGQAGDDQRQHGASQGQRQGRENGDGLKHRTNSSTSTASTISTPAPMARAKSLVQLVHELGVPGFHQMHAFGQMLQRRQCIYFSWWRCRVRRPESNRPPETAAGSDCSGARAEGPWPKLRSATDFKARSRPTPWARADSPRWPDRAAQFSTRLTRMGIWRSTSENFAPFCGRSPRGRDPNGLADALHADAQLRRHIQARMHDDLRRGRSPLMRASRISFKPRISASARLTRGFDRRVDRRRMRYKPMSRPPPSTEKFRWPSATAPSSGIMACSHSFWDCFSLRARHQADIQHGVADFRAVGADEFDHVGDGGRFAQGWRSRPRTPGRCPGSVPPGGSSMSNSELA